MQRITRPLLRHFSFVRHEPKRYFYLQYKYIPDMTYYQIEVKGKHHAKLKKLAEEKGAKIVGGYQFPLNGGMLFVEADDDSFISEWTEIDPYIRGQLATEWTVKELSPLLSKLPFELHAKKFDYK